MTIPLCPLKRKALDLKTGPFGSALSADEYIEGGVPLINPSDLRDGRIQVGGAVTVPEAVAERLSAYRLRAGDVVMGRRGELGRYGLAGRAEVGYLCGTGSLLVRPGPELEARFFGYYLETDAARAWLKLQSVGATMENLSETILARLPIPNLPHKQQYVLANYLDAKTAAIDALIAKKELLVEELRKYTQAVITQAVLRGVDESAELVPSRGPEMGPIPSHWEVAKTSKVLRYIKGSAVAKEELATDGDASHRFLRTGDLWNINGHEKDRAFVTQTDGLVWKSEGELVVCFDGFNSVAGKGTVGMARFDGAGYIDSHLEKVDVRSPIALRRYFEYVHLSTYLENEIVKTARGAIAFSAGYGKSEILVPVPPLDEQLAIAEYLDVHLSTIRPLIENALRAIPELKRLRASLISEAVTGKLQVPD